MLIAIYSKDVFPDKERVFNKRCESRKECIDVLRDEFNKQDNLLCFWYPHIFNESTQQFEELTKDELTSLHVSI